MWTEVSELKAAAGLMLVDCVVDRRSLTNIGLILHSIHSNHLLVLYHHLTFYSRYPHVRCTE